MPLSNLVVGSLVSFILGIALASFFIISNKAIFLAGIIFLFFFFLFVFIKRWKIAFYFLFLIFLLLGVFRFQLTGNSAKFSDNYFFSGFSKKIETRIENYFSPPHSSLLSAIILGKSYKMGKEWNNKLSLAGVRHITAVSGMHIIIISMIFFWLFLKLGISRQKSHILILFVIWFFVALVGSRPSAIRAGIMASLLIFSQWVGRPYLSGRFLLYAAFIMLLINPLLLGWSISFQLSFLATAGIIYFFPLIKFYLDKAGLIEKSGISALLALTLSAQLAVFPLLIYNFGKISVVSPITNILIIPLLPFLLSAFFVFLVFAFTFPPFAFIFSLILWLLLEFIILIVNFFSSLSFSAISFPKQFSFLAILGLYSLIVWLIIFLKRKSKNDLLFEVPIIS